MKTNKKGLIALTALALSVLMIGVFTSSLLSGDIAPTKASAETLSSLTALASTAADLESPFKTVYDEASQSIVGIRLTTQLSVSRGRITSESAYVGSGVVINDDGYIITNYHVVTANTGVVASEIMVVYNEEEFPAKYIAGDEESDVAVLKVNGLNAPAAKLGNSDEISIGDWALVIGNPIGETFANTLTVGVISGKNRDVTSRDRTGKTTKTTMIQTNAQVNSGNSGGGLFNIRGELVGITSMKLSSNGYFSGASIEGIGFAIPINKVTSIADELIEYGEVRAPQYPRIGVSIRDVPGGSEEPTKETLPSSILVLEVEPGSPAERAGIEPNDLIVRADGERVRSTQDLQGIIRSHEVGETVEIEVYRVPGIRSIKADEDIPEGTYHTFTVDLEIIDEIKQ